MGSRLSDSASFGHELPERRHLSDVPIQHVENLRGLELPGPLLNGLLCQQPIRLEPVDCLVRWRIGHVDQCRCPWDGHDRFTNTASASSLTDGDRQRIAPGGSFAVEGDDSPAAISSFNRAGVVATTRA